MKRERLNKSSSSGRAPLKLSGWLLRVSFFAAACALGLFIVLFEYEPQSSSAAFKLGEPAPRTFFSPFMLHYIDEQKTEELRSQAVSGQPDTYVLKSEVNEQMTEQVDKLFSLLHDAKASPGAPEAIREGDLPFPVSASVLEYLRTEPVLEEARKGIELLFEKTLAAGILRAEDKKHFAETGIQKINLVKPDASGSSEKIVFTRNLRDAAEAREFAGGLLPESLAKRRTLRQAVLEIYSTVLRPNVFFDENATKLRRDAVLSSVKPIQETIHKDELVIQRGVLVSAKEKKKLDLIQKKRTEAQIVKKWSSAALLAFLTYAIFFVYLFLFERRMLFSWRQIALFNTVILVSLLICKIIRVWPGSSPFLMPGALAPLLLALLAGPRFGLSASFVMTGLLASLGGFSPEIILTVLFSGTVGTLSAFRLRKRLEFLRVGLAVGLTVAGILFSSSIFHDYSVQDASQHAAFGLINGLLITTPCLFLLLAIFEAGFNLATDITLLELSDLNHPLLKRMIIEAPGTYHHSLVVSRLAEGACEEIGANSLLARVGCYFHDIGKMVQSHYFTENQTGKYPSKHEKLTPAMSSFIIINHVKDGVELGKKYKLKESVLKFIPEHQGTGIVYFFYRKALDQAAPGEVVNPDNYRYPGPNPQSKETAVALLADSVEAASRSVREPSMESLRTLVRKIINDKFIDGQLDECDLTLKDLHKIQESFVRNLLAIFHTRVPYPEKPQDPEKPDLFAKIGHPKPPVKA